jgi:hypothetical protein
MCKGTIRASLIVSCVALAMLAINSVIGYCAGRSIDTALRFLTPGRAPTPEEAVAIYPIEYALQTKEPNDVLFLGDSTCRHDVDPIEFERLTGLKAYNLGMLGMTGPTAYVITLQAYLSKHPAPKAALLCITPYAFEQGDDCDEGRGLGKRFAAVYRDGASSISTMIRRGVLQFKRADRDARDLTFGDDRFRGETYRTVQARLRASRGFWALTGESSGQKAPPWNGERLKLSNDWTTALPALEETCRKAGITFLLRITPMRPDMKTAKDWSPAERFLGRPVVECADPSLCWDHVHLNRAGVEKFTAAVAKDVQAALRDVR